MAAAKGQSEEVKDLLKLFQQTIVRGVAHQGFDLSARQMGVFLTTYLDEGPHTVRGLAARLNITKPAVSRAIDRLTLLELLRRRPDPEDRRSVNVVGTQLGNEYLRRVGNDLVAASRTCLHP